MLGAEIDWRYSSVQRIFEALSEGLQMVEKDLKEAEKTDTPYDAGSAMDEIDSLLGIAFVTAQTYITSTISDANKIAKPTVKYKKDKLLKDYSEFLPGLKITKMELCDAMANYFKHPDEWPVWSATGSHQKTVSVLQSAGVSETDSYPCSTAATIILQSEKLDLNQLLDILSTWRESVIQAVKPK